MTSLAIPGGLILAVLAAICLVLGVIGPPPWRKRPDQPARLSPAGRADILRWASWLAGRDGSRSPDAVTVAALPLLEWAEGARDRDDLVSRMRAMGQQYCNLGTSRSEPGQFVRDAEVLYEFIIAGQAGRPVCADPDRALPGSSHMEVC